MSLRDQANLYALRYATEATKVHLMNTYKREFPHFFDTASIETRPATSADYYIPPSLVGKAIVVVRTSFDETRCRRMSCFPFKENWDMCTEHDKPRWISIGRQFEVACPPACRELPLHTEWVKGKCVVANPLKKILASMPEKLFQQASRHIYHNGLDVVQGTLKFNREYCEAYGLKLFKGGCTSFYSQSYAEWLFGMTPIRAAITAGLKPHVTPPPPASLPQYLNYSVPKKKKKNTTREKRAATSSLNEDVSQEIAEELGKELGEQVTEWSVRMFLEKKAPMLFSRAVDRLSAKLVIKHSMAVSIKRFGNVVLRAMGKTTSGIGTAFAVFEVVVAILDVIDPYDFNKVLSPKDLQDINNNLDYEYFQDTPIRPEMTPEYMWDRDLLMRDESEKFEFMVERVEEYLAALNAAPAPAAAAAAAAASGRTGRAAHLSMYVWKEDQTAHWDKKLFICLGIVILCTVWLSVEWIDVWACCLLFVKIYFKV